MLIMEGILIIKGLLVIRHIVNHDQTERF